MEGSSSQHFQNNQHRVLRFGTINFSDYQGPEVSSSKSAVVSSQGVQNLALKESVNENEDVGRGSMVPKQNYPARPEADNCFYFMQYGWCKFGANCRYNYPCNQLLEANKEIMRPAEDNFSRMKQVIECQYYLKPEGCENQKSFGYDHSGCNTVVAPVLEFNFLGLPIRQGQKECPHFRRKGSCKYGVNCWFDHPDPSSMGGGFPHSGLRDDMSGWPLSGPANEFGLFDHYFYQPAEFGQFGYTSFGDTMPCWSLAGPVNEFGPFDPYFYQPAEYAPYSEWTGYQVPSEHHDAPIYTIAERSQPTAVALSMKSLSADAKAYDQQINQPTVADVKAYDQKINQPTVVKKESPKANVQPGRPFKFGFGFQHPKTSLCSLNGKGLPLRPDMEVCAFYKRNGLCREGPACRFDHPATLRKVVASGSEEAQVPAAPAGSQETHVPPAKYTL